MRRRLRATLSELERIKAEERKLREAKIALLKAELAKAREAVRNLERELRVLGDADATRSAGRISWDEVYDQLGGTFTAADMAAATGASSNLVGSIVHRWKQRGKVVATARRGFYRKAGQGGRRTR